MKVKKLMTDAKIIKADLSNSKHKVIFVRIPCINNFTQFKFVETMHGIWMSENKIEFHDKLQNIIISPIFRPEVNVWKKIFIGYEEE